MKECPVVELSPLESCDRLIHGLSLYDGMDMAVFFEDHNEERFCLVCAVVDRSLPIDPLFLYGADVTREGSIYALLLLRALIVSPTKQSEVSHAGVDYNT